MGIYQEPPVTQVMQEFMTLPIGTEIGHPAGMHAQADQEEEEEEQDVGVV
jgi:hypothetical protein